MVRFEARSSWADALEEARAFKGKSKEAHYQAFADACALAFLSLENHPERERWLAYQDPLSEESKTLLEKLKTSGKHT